MQQCCNNKLIINNKYTCGIQNLLIFVKQKGIISFEKLKIMIFIEPNSEVNGKNVEIAIKNVTEVIMDGKTPVCEKAKKYLSIELPTEVLESGNEEEAKTIVLAKLKEMGYAEIFNEQFPKNWGIYM